MTTKKSFAKKVWDTFSTLDLGDKVETKGKGSYALSYVSWAYAVEVLMSHFPESLIEELEPTKYPDETMSVRFRVTVKEGDDSLAREMWLPVMDHKNQAIKNPNARQISDANMRCLVKCAALFGLGLYVYAGEDVPSSVEDEAPAKKPASKPTPDDEKWSEILTRAQTSVSSGKFAVEEIVSMLNTNWKLTENQVQVLLSIGGSHEPA